jgi:ribosomal protein S12 methylthiotransferase accessory factor
MWNITGNAGIAAFHCLIAERHVDAHRRMYAAEGAGCHPVRHIAFLRALTEAAQSRLTAISGARDDMPRTDYERWRQPGNLAAHSDVAGRKGSQPFSEVPSYESDSFESDIAFELERVRGAGFDRVIAIDLSLPEFGLAVVRVVIPGMQAETSSIRIARHSAAGHRETSA